MTDQSENNAPKRGSATAEGFDVVIVGARCAGAPLAALLARSGLGVVLLEQAKFPRDTLSTHLIEADGLSFLGRLGVHDRLRETGAPFIERADIRAENFSVVDRWPHRPEDGGGIMSVRRLLLDPILVEAAAEAGADIRMGTKVSGLLEDRGRVTGVRAVTDGEQVGLRARLVVGADGRNSTVAGLCGSLKYNVTPNQRAFYWSFFEDADLKGEPTFVLHRWRDRFILGCPTDSGLYQVLVAPELGQLDCFKSNLEEHFMEQALSCEPVAHAIGGAKRVGKFFGVVRWRGFFRQASGPGWVLAGDAGHFKDPSVGRGISDAFLQVDALAPAIVKGLGGSPRDLDGELVQWGRWRDREFAEHYWFAVDFGDAGGIPAVIPESLRRLQARGKIDRIFQLLNHRTKPSQVVTPPILLGATARLLARRNTDRRALLREVRSQVADGVRRRLLSRNPIHADTNPAVADAGPTEIEDNAAPALAD